MPWVTLTQQIKRLIRKLDHLYQQIRSKFVELRKKIKASHMTYLEGLLGLEEGSTCDSKKIFAFLKNSKQDQVGSPQLKLHNDKLITDTRQKVNLLISQFQSVFTTKGPLSLSRLCTMNLQDMTKDSKTQPLLGPTTPILIPIMEEFGISTAGILKLLKNIKPGKAAGPDRLKPLLLRELRIERKFRSFLTARYK